MRLLQLELFPTPAMLAGEAHIDQCTQCGALVCHHAHRLGECPACKASTTWWRQAVPATSGHVAGPFHVKEIPS